MKVPVILALGFILLLVGTFALFNRPQSSPSIDQPPSPAPTAEEKVNFAASFTVVTGNITRSFKAEKYHNLSPDVYISSAEPTIIHVKKPGITWDDFFKTLPMKLTSECLTTGDGEKLCNDTGSLKFYLNDIETPDLLEKPINEGDKALIKFTSS
ncbi:hypothetical protein HYS92_01040 [Candidatus Daviesbacteria bacterium]|nr:hypothetical protein [Candidatus Daviesbacteria bacterium]